MPVMDRSKKELKRWDADEILSKNWLKKLYLFQNHLTNIPDAVAEFTELQVLFLPSFLPRVPPCMLSWCELCPDS